MCHLGQAFHNTIVKTSGDCSIFKAGVQIVYDSMYDRAGQKYCGVIVVGKFNGISVIFGFAGAGWITRNPIGSETVFAVWTSLSISLFTPRLPWVVK